MIIDKILKSIKENKMSGIEVESILSTMSVSYGELSEIEEALNENNDSMYENEYKDSEVLNTCDSCLHNRVSSSDKYCYLLDEYDMEYCSKYESRKKK